jgi:ketosteroid isomerase-like protein
MRTTFLSLLVVLFFIGCNTTDKAKIKREIGNTEKAFETMAADKGIAEAFTYFADENAVISRGNDSVIKGKGGIRNYYFKKDLKNAHVNWKPDFIDVSASGDLGYTYGHYCWKIVDEKGDTTTNRGIFHTVWKRQTDGSWRYVWD